VGDITRKMGPFLNDKPDIEKSGTFFYLILIREALRSTWNLSQAKYIHQLLHKADIVVEKLRTGKNV